MEHHTPKGEKIVQLHLSFFYLNLNGETLKKTIKLAKKSAINVTLGAGNLLQLFLHFRALCSRKPLLGGDQKHSLYKIMQYFEAAGMYLSSVLPESRFSFFHYSVGISDLWHHLIYFPHLIPFKKAR